MSYLLNAIILKWSLKTSPFRAYLTWMLYNYDDKIEVYVVKYREYEAEFCFKYKEVKNNITLFSSNG